MIFYTKIQFYYVIKLDNRKNEFFLSKTESKIVPIFMRKFWF